MARTASRVRYRWQPMSWLPLLCDGCYSPSSPPLACVAVALLPGADPMPSLHWLAPLLAPNCVAGHPPLAHTPLCLS